MASVEQTMMKVQRILTGPLGLRVEVDEESFWVRFQNVSTVLHIVIRDWGTDSEGEPRSLVMVNAPILRDVRPTPELYEWVARKGGSKWFGHVEVHDQEESGHVLLLMSHTLLGDFLDEDELASAMFTVMEGADEFDDELQPRFGGRKATE
jgi:hypothetical protein